MVSTGQYCSSPLRLESVLTILSTITEDDDDHDVPSVYLSILSETRVNGHEVGFETHFFSERFLFGSMDTFDVKLRALSG